MLLCACAFAAVHLRLPKCEPPPRELPDGLLVLRLGAGLLMLGRLPEPNDPLPRLIEEPEGLVLRLGIWVLNEPRLGELCV